MGQTMTERGSGAVQNVPLLRVAEAELAGHVRGVATENIPSLDDVAPGTRQIRDRVA